MLTFTNLKDRVNKAIGNRSSIDTELGEFVNFAYQFVWNEVTLHEKEAITTDACVAAQQYISYPTGYLSVSAVDVNGSRMDKGEWREYLEIGTFASAVPTRYFVFADRIYWDTAPDDTYTVTLYCIKDPTELSAGSDTLDLPPRLESPLISRAIALAWRYLNQPEKAAYWFEQATQDLVVARTAIFREDEDFDHGMTIRRS